jgi:hypothetical protein
MSKIREQIVSEGIGYQGIYFAENENLTKLVKNLKEDIEALGESTVLELYGAIYGREFAEALEPIIEDKALLEEVAECKKMLLFENFGPDRSIIQPYKFDLSPRKFNQNPAANAEHVKNMFKDYQYETPKANTGLLGGLWDKIKKAGSGILSSLGFGPNSLSGLLGPLSAVAKVVAPILTIVGGYKILKNLILPKINSMREKKGSPKITQEQLEQIMAQQKEKAKA